MNKTVRHLLSCVTCMLAAMATWAASAGAANAQYPDKAIRFVVPYAPGGSSDQVARLVAVHAETALGQPLVVDNKSGAGGAIGSDAVAKARPDGYTLLLAAIAPMSILPFAQTRLPYDPQKDLAAVTLINTNPFLVVVHPSMPAANIRELVDVLKANPGKYNYASVGNGSLGHLAGELFKSMAGVEMLHVGFRGGAPALMETLAGRTQVMFANINEALPHVKAGRLKALAVTSLKRSDLMSTMPTVDESGLAGYEAIAWNGVAAPAGTPKAVIDQLNTEMVKVVHRQDVAKAMREMGLTPVGSSPEEFADLVRREQAKWGALIRKSNLKLD